MNYLFIIQGEGRGHLSQAIALKAFIEQEGDQVTRVFAGDSPQRALPEYVKNIFGEKLKTFRSPNFLRTKDKKGIRIGMSICYNLFFAVAFVRSINLLRKEIKWGDYDIVINFYDMLGGMAAYFSRSDKKIISISHHYYLTNSDFHFPKGQIFCKIGLKLHSFLCAISASEIWALSFLEKNELQTERLKIKPPLLRQVIFDLVPEDKYYVLVYLLNEGWLKEISDLANQFPDTLFKVYVSITEMTIALPENMKICDLHDEKYLAEMQYCHLLITTAGFESQCEAAYLGKAVYTLPSKNHFEQQCNALDGQLAGISKKFDTHTFQINNDSIDNSEFKIWCRKWKEK